MMPCLTVSLLNKLGGEWASSGVGVAHRHNSCSQISGPNDSGEDVRDG